eukprot:CAMPEP_0170481598 /NCGR_PEP_ID=MMETSP0208-20121228/1985_1 /TAXON_ID=197538 /ORGANISM="Strombidium inclinatum, Strain S3" /LENGTH=124 /DNA_ID=CAMNT_0010754333 /DNA_START=29 /DNA_END=400 /DNA_ORIENTATION=-
MKATFFAAALVALLGSADAVNLDSLAKSQAAVATLVESTDGPTNGEMNEDEKDTLIQVLCPGTNRLRSPSPPARALLATPARLRPARKPLQPWCSRTSRLEKPRSLEALTDFEKLEKYGDQKPP